MTKLLAHVPGVVWSLCVMTTVPPQPSVATTAPSFGAGTALAHLTVTLAGMLVMTGAVVSVTSTSVVQVVEQPAALAVFSCSVNVAPHAEPARTLTVCVLVGPEIEPLPVSDQE